MLYFCGCYAGQNSKIGGLVWQACFSQFHFQTSECNVSLVLLVNLIAVAAADLTAGNLPMAHMLS